MEFENQSGDSLSYIRKLAIGNQSEIKVWLVEDLDLQRIRKDSAYGTRKVQSFRVVDIIYASMIFSWEDFLD